MCCIHLCLESGREQSGSLPMKNQHASKKPGATAMNHEDLENAKFARKNQGIRL